MRYYKLNIILLVFLTSVALNGWKNSHAATVKYQEYIYNEVFDYHTTGGYYTGNNTPTATWSMHYNPFNAHAGVDIHIDPFDQSLGTLEGVFINSWFQSYSSMAVEVYDPFFLKALNVYDGYYYYAGPTIMSYNILEYAARSDTHNLSLLHKWFTGNDSRTIITSLVRPGISNLVEIFPHDLRDLIPDSQKYWSSLQGPMASIEIGTGVSPEVFNDPWTFFFSWNPYITTQGWEVESWWDETLEELAIGIRPGGTGMDIRLGVKVVYQYSTIPIPSTFFLLAFGLVALVGRRIKDR